MCEFSRLPVAGDTISFKYTHDTGEEVSYKCPVLRVNHSQEDEDDSVEIGMAEDWYHKHCVPDEKWEPMLFPKD